MKHGGPGFGQCSFPANGDGLPQGKSYVTVAEPACGSGAMIIGLIRHLQINRFFIRSTFLISRTFYKNCFLYSVLGCFSQ